MALDKAPVLNRWALLALGDRYKKGNTKAEIVLRDCLLKCPNPDIVPTVVDIIYPLKSDSLTKGLLRDIAHCNSEMDYYKYRISKIKNAKMDPTLRKIQIQSAESRIHAWKYRLRAAEEYLLKHRIGAKQ